MNYPPDPGLQEVLSRLGVAPEAYLGHGGEAWVYALDDQRVVRVLHHGGEADQLYRNVELIAELSAGDLPYELPSVQTIDEIGGRAYAIERRLPGQSLLQQLRTMEGRRRDKLIEAYLEAVAFLGQLSLSPRPYWGDLVGRTPVRGASWREYLEAKARSGLARGLPAMSVDATALTLGLSEPDGPGFAHLDAFAGNVMTDGDRITAILDFGPACVVGDIRFSPVAAAVYLGVPSITPTATPRDIEIADSWLRTRDLGQLFDPVRQWLAGYWAFAVDDPKLLAWCRSVLAPN